MKQQPPALAFPGAQHFQFGLTKRELFAAMAMQGVLASEVNSGFGSAEERADFVVKIADALINRLNEGEPK